MFHFRSLALLILLVLSTPLWSQDVEIVVTATKEPTAAETLPVGVTVLDADDLKDKSSVSDALQSTLAVRLDSLVPGQLSLAAPGFGEGGFGRIQLMIDGVGQNYPDMSAPSVDLLPLFAIERIEVLRGAGSTLYGNGALAGAVNLVTKIPRKWESEASLTLLSDLSNRQSFALAAPLGPGGVIVSVQRDQLFPSRDRSDSDQYQLWSKAQFPVAGSGVDQDWSLWAGVSRTVLQFPGSLNEAQFESDPDQSTEPKDEGIRTETRGGFSWSAEGGDWSVRVPVSASYRLVHNQDASNYGAAYSVYSDTELTQWNVEPRFARDGALGSASWSWSAGLGTSGAHFGLTRYDGEDWNTTALEAAVQRTALWVWNRAEVSWDESVFVSGAIRVEGAATKASSEQQPGVDGRTEFWPVSGQAGLTWLPSQGLKVGVEGARIFRYPAIDEMIYYAGYWPYSFDKKLDPEVGHSLTATAGWKQGDVALEATGTALRMENEIVGGLSSNQNSGPTWHGSVLASAEWKLESAAVGTEYTYELARYASGDYEGKDLPLVPNQRGRLWTSWNWQRTVTVEGSWTLASGYYTSGDYQNAESAVSGRQNADVSVTVVLGSTGATLRVFGKNLTDDRTPTYVYSYIDPNPLYTSFGWYPLEGRTFGTTLTWRL